MPGKYEFEVAMTCEGCSGALNRILDRHKGKDIEEHVVDLATKKVSVTSSVLDREAVQAIVEKCGKDVKFLSEQPA